jgi:RNA polymerase sigma-70 factor (ECF subfamily)
MDDRLPPAGQVPPGGDGRGLVAAYAGLVRSFFARRCASAEDAEDLAQDALCAVMEAAGRFRGEAAASTWVWAICRNTWMNWLDSKRREARIGQAAIVESLARAGPWAAPCEAPKDGELALGLDLAAALSRLGPSESRLYRLFYVEGRKVKEIALLLGKPEGTVKYLLSLLRARLKELLS